MLDKILALDKQLLIFLNNLGSPVYDEFWLFATKQFNWIFLFLWVFYLIFKKLNWKQLLLLVVTLAFLITFVDQMTNLVKHSVERLRPCNDETVNQLIRIVQERSSFSFFSGHASNSMANAVFIFMVLKSFYRFSYLVFIFPLVFAFSRIYLGLHFPLDIIVGYAFGGFFGLVFFKVFSRISEKHFFKISK